MRLILLLAGLITIETIRRYRAGMALLKEEGVDPKVIAECVLGDPEAFKCPRCGSLNVEHDDEGLDCEDCNFGIRFPHVAIVCPACGAKDHFRRTAWAPIHCTKCFQAL